MRIALLEDDSAQSELLQGWLADAGHSCHAFAEGRPFLQQVVRESFDILIVDWMLPDIEGLEVLTRVRELIDWPIPVLFITSRDSEEDIVTALQGGADDYIVKPPKQQETLARIAVLVRRNNPSGKEAEDTDFPPYCFDRAKRVVTFGEQMAELTEKEFNLALLLFRNTGRIFSRGHLLEVVWGQTADINTRTVDTHVSKVRTKLSISPEQGWRLSSVYQHGYRLEQLESAST